MSHHTAPITDPITVRVATAADVVDIAAQDRAMWGDWAISMPIYRQLIDFFAGLVWVARTDDGKLAGCAAGLVHADGRGWVLCVDVSPSYRGMGVGRQLLDCLLHAFEDHTVHEITAIIDGENVASQRLFATFGFHHIATDLNYFEPGHPQQRWIKTRAEAIQTEQ